jgi:hypothetical protein
VRFRNPKLCLGCPASLSLTCSAKTGRKCRVAANPVLSRTSWSRRIHYGAPLRCNWAGKVWELEPSSVQAAVCRGGEHLAGRGASARVSRRSQSLTRRWWKELQLPRLGRLPLTAERELKRGPWVDCLTLRSVAFMPAVQKKASERVILLAAGEVPLLLNVLSVKDHHEEKERLVSKEYTRYPRSSPAGS